MAKRSGSTYRITGPDDFMVEAKHPADGVALSWAIGVLCFREGDDRPGKATPMGDYTLSFVGGAQVEPMFHMRKTENSNDRMGPTVSWDGA